MYFMDQQESAEGQWDEPIKQEKVIWAPCCNTAKSLIDDDDHTIIMTMIV